MEMQMASKSPANGKTFSKMEAVRQIVTADPNTKASDIVEKARAKFGVDITPQMASTYRYHILSKQHRKQRKAVRKVQAANPATTDASNGVDDLLRAARKLGWKRVNEIVQGVLNAPS
jgi:hypothetical protein